MYPATNMYHNWIYLYPRIYMSGTGGGGGGAGCDLNHYVSAKNVGCAACLRRVCVFVWVRGGPCRRLCVIQIGCVRRGADLFLNEFVVILH